ncbi:histone acetlytransferase ESA1 [Vairimorpha necatrix]|uniref:histone acetyltransferase n=1 Tax=Vairimorpha necatrix TaxID=6039 RepID=A0AAX4JDS0_9MICR
MDPETINIGYKLFVQKPEHKDKQKAEILGIRLVNDKLEFYIHYIDQNRRLDEWISYSFLCLDDISTIEIPKKKKKIEEVHKKTTDLNSVDDEKEAVKMKDEEYKIKNIKKIQFGKYLVEPWYFSPYPKSITNADVVFICEKCLYYFNNKKIYSEHIEKCEMCHPPGREIYRNNGLSFFEMDGYTEQKYCRNLALLSKLFLDHKSLYYDIDVFLFYVLCRVDNFGFTIVGYFSKEKISEQGYNLACILTLPFEQRKGYGRILMDFSYMLSKKDNLISGPEKPLSDLGLLSYRAYWLDVIVDYLIENSNSSVDEISKATHITVEDIISTLTYYNVLKLYKGTFIYALDDKIKTRAKKFKQKRLNEKYLRYI